jgi:hypothetical protein
MNRLNCMINGAVLGAGAMYFFDPQLGRRRRALLEDQFRRFSRQASEGLDAAVRDLNNRAQGTVAEVEHLFMPEEISDDVLRERIRSLAGRYLSNASALRVDVADGCVCLSGPVLADEAGPLVRAVRFARGVRSVDNQLEPHESRGNISALQGSGQRTGDLPELFQANWAPGTRLVAGAAGAMMMLNCMVNRGIGSMLWGTLGFGLLNRAMVNPTTSRSRRHAGRMQQSGQQQRESSGFESERREAGPRTPWPPASAAAPAAGVRTEGVSGQMSSGDQDRPDVWPQSRATPVQQTGMAGPFADQ